MDEYQRNYVKGKKADLNGNMPHYFIYMTLWRGQEARVVG